MTKEARWLLNEKYAGKKTPGYFADLKRLGAGEPLAYVIGWVDFLGCRIDLSPRLPHGRGQVRPLIPRPETEFWVEKAISTIRTNYHDSSDRSIHGSSRNRMATGVRGAGVKILDLFAGSGCIGVALLKHLPNAMADFGEKDSRLCKQIKKNLALNGISPARARVIKTDVLSGITGTYDYIFANPPYIDPAKKRTVQSSVLKYEPREALFAKEHGLFFIKKLLAEGEDRLRKGGTMYIEFGQGQKSELEKLARTYRWSTAFTKDQFGKWRMVKIIK